MRPASVSTRNILPGCRRPFSTTRAGSMSSTPNSLASTTRPSRRDDVLRGAQPVAIERRADELAVGEAERRRAVPRLDEAAVVLVEAPSSRRHVGCRAPTLRGRASSSRAAASDRSRARKSTTLSSDAESEPPGRMIGLKSSMVLVEERRSASSASRADIQCWLPRSVLISPLCAMQPVRMRALPRGERVGREARVHHARAALTVRSVGEIGIERARPARRASGPCRRRSATSSDAM